MVDTKKEILPVNIEDELKRSYLDYAMSVIIGRALPDVRDGLKPVHRRTLFAMNELNNAWNKPYKKSARVVGDVIGKYHPHGDTAAYDTIVRMAQDFSLRYLLVDGQGNFGSVDGDSAAAMRYTEIRMTKIAHALMADLEKETVDFVPNYDGTEQIPDVLPTKIPNLLINGSTGIAVGMATNIPPHNLKEVISACLALIDNPQITFDELLTHIPGPDFPTGATINGRAGILSAYRTGKGRIYIRANAEVIEDNKRQKIIITELPYQVNKARLIEKIAALIKDKKIEGISEIRDESDKDGLRVVIELRRGESGEVILNNLYTQTQLESVFGINMVALVDGRPQLLTLKQMLEAFVRHRREVVTRRTVFELRKARQRGHILEGLAVALSNIDPVIKIIKASKSSQEAQETLIRQEWGAGYVLEMLDGADKNICRPESLPVIYGIDGSIYRFSPEQAKAILDMRLHRLTGLEHEKLITEYKELLLIIAELVSILADPEKLLDVIRTELKQMMEEFSDDRRTQITSSRHDLTVEDLINEQDMVVTLSHSGYAKTTPLSEYQSQRRGGKGKSATALKEEDFVEHMLVANTHTQILLFSSKGKMYWMKVYQIPEASRISRGRPVINLLPLDEGEKITTMLPVEAFTEGHYIFMVTRFGTVKKVALPQFSRPRSTGLIAIGLNEGDALVQAAITNGNNDVMLLTNAGKAVRFHESDVRDMGRQARGVRGIRLKDGQEVISLVIPDDNAQILTVSESGHGKRTPVTDFRTINRGGQGVIAMQCNDRNGAMVGGVQVLDGEEIMLISNLGTLIRTRVDEVRVMGRNTQGVRLLRVRGNEQLVGVDRIEEPDMIEEEEEEEVNNSETLAET
ncbi:MAG: DNA gyrase subunit A [Endozoicomonadaceae bacterium]|nr:DNA gyrase subunit A [Endozoicomonadaceae bacterium]